MGLILATKSRADLAAVDPLPGTGFNGGRSQLVFNFLQYGGAFPFINHLKTAQTWGTVNSTTAIPPTVVNANGYPTSVHDGGLTATFFIPNAAKRPGQYRLRWTGTGTLGTGGLAPTAATNGNLTFTPSGSANGNSLIVTLSIYAGTNITNIEYFHEDDEADLDDGKIFSQPFLDKLVEGNWGVLRFLDWQLANKTNVAKWAHRKPVDYVFYDGHELRADIWAGTTGGSTTAYTVAAPPGWVGLVDKAMVSVIFHATATSNAPTLNVASTGAKVILNQYGSPLNPFGGTAERPTTPFLGTLTYDADLNAWIKFGGDLLAYNHYIANGVPIEILAALCEEVGAHPWFVTPYLSCDPITDWTTSLATYLRDNMPAWMIPRFEVAPNECWNSYADFYSTGYAARKSETYWPGGSFGTWAHDWAGKVASTNAQAISAVYAGDRSKYWAILGMWTGSGEGESADHTRMNSDLYVSEDAGDPARDWITHIAIADYYGGTYSAGQLDSAATAYGAAVGAPAKLAIATTYVDSMMADSPGNDQYRFGAARFVTERLPYWSTFLEAYPGVEMTFYEGGYSVDYSYGTSNPNMATFFLATKNDVAGLATVNTYVYDGCVAVGSFPSHYNFSGATGWGLFDPDLHSTPSKQYDSIVTFNTP